MLQQALWGQPASVPHLRRLLHLLAVSAALGIGAASYAVWSTQANLATTLASVRAIKRQTTQMSGALQTKRERVAQVAGLQTSDPLGQGSLELTAEFSRLAHAAGVQIGAFRITPLNAAPAPAAATAPQAANPAGGTADAAAPQAPASANRWEQATFEYEFTGAFHALTALLHDLAEMPRIIEINTVELARAQSGGTQETITVRLRLSGTFYGLPEAEKSQ